MQTVIPLSSSHPLRGVSGLARQIALPAEAVPARFPSFPALERTAVMGFNQPTNLDLVSLRETKVLVTRQSTYPVWADKQRDWCYTARYKVQRAANHGFGQEAEVALGVPILDSWFVGNMLASLGQMGVSGGVNSFTYPVFGADRPGTEFFYVPAAGKAVMNFAFYGVPGATTKIDVTMEVWESPQQISTRLVSVIIGASYMNAGAELDFSGWVRPVSVIVRTAAEVEASTHAFIYLSTASASSVVISTSGVNAGQLHYTSGSEFALLPLTVPSEFGNSTLPWYAARTTAASMLATNVSQVLFKGGTILAGRVSPAVVNPFTVGSSYLSNLHPAEKAFLPLETGFYTYVPPSTDMLRFDDYTLNTANGAAAAPVYVLSNDSMVNVAFFTASASAESLAITVTWHMEFRTSSALFSVGLSTLTLESLHTAQLVLAEFGFFFENPEHKKLLGKLLGVAKKFVPQAITMVNPTAGKVLKAAIAMTPVLRPKPGPLKVPATSGQNSGIVAPTTKAHTKKKKKH